MDKAEARPLIIPKSNVIGFRVHPEVLQILAKRQLPEESIHDTAKRILLEAIQRQLELEVLHQDIAQVLVQEKQTQAMLVSGFEAVLHSAGAVTREQAREFVEKRLCSPFQNR